MRLIRLFNKTEHRVKRDLNLIRIVKNLRELKILSNNSPLMNEYMKFETEHSHKCVINLESSGVNENTSNSEFDVDMFIT